MVQQSPKAVHSTHGTAVQYLRRIRGCFPTEIGLGFSVESEAWRGEVRLGTSLAGYWEYLKRLRMAEYGLLKLLSFTSRSRNLPLKTITRDALQ